MRKRAFVAFALVAACGGEDGNTGGIPDECNPLGGQACMMPWPTMIYAKEDAASATGFRLDIPQAAMPVNVDGAAIDPTPFNRRDGFSTLGPILAAFPTGVSPAGLPSFKNPDESLAADSPVVLIDMATGERTPLFAEVDQNVMLETARNLMIRPLARLKPSSRYAVGIRKGVRALDGGELPSPDAFVAIRDGGSFTHPKFAALKTGVLEAIDALEAAGVPADDLVLAWDFVTVSDEYIRSDLTTMREAALPAIGTNGANLTFTAQTRPNTATSFRRYVGTYTSPDFLTDGEADASVMRRGADGLPVMQGMGDRRFAAIIPDCVQTAPLPRPTIIFGHGLFGSAEEYLDDDFVADLAQDHCFVIIAGDFIGLTSRQLHLAPLAVNDLNKGAQVTEKLEQSIIDFIALEHAARGPMAQSAEFQLNGQSVIDTSNIFYVGGSLGGNMGNTFMAYDPNITKGVLAVPGGNWWLMIERSTAWALLVGAAQGAYDDPEEYQLALSMSFGMGFEPFDSMTTAAHVIKDPLFGQPAKQILMWYAIGDCLVTNIASELVAREMGLPLLAPSVVSPWGMTAQTGPLASGVTVYNDHPTPMPFDSNIPPIEDNGTHSGINKLPAPMRQVEQFLISSGQVVDECKINEQAAPCDCSTGACN
jgi:pimeloyl-ACP methyl ester carboxylesterase